MLFLHNHILPSHFTADQWPAQLEQQPITATKKKKKFKTNAMWKSSDGKIMCHLQYDMGLAI